MGIVMQPWTLMSSYSNYISNGRRLLWLSRPSPVLICDYFVVRKKFLTVETSISAMPI